MQRIVLLTVGLLLIAGCGDDATGLVEGAGDYFPVKDGDFWMWNYAASEDREGTADDFTKTGWLLWIVEDVVQHDDGFDVFEISISSETIKFFESNPVDTTSTSSTIYYRVTEEEVREYYSLSSSTNWLILDLPLTAGKTWIDVEDQEYTVVSVDTTVTVPAGTFSLCALVDCDWNMETLPTHNFHFYKQGVGIVCRVFHQENEISTYHSTWELSSSTRL